MGSSEFIYLSFWKPLFRVPCELQHQWTNQDLNIDYSKKRKSTGSDFWGLSRCFELDGSNGSKVNVLSSLKRTLKDPKDEFRSNLFRIKAGQLIIYNNTCDLQ